ncbi:site-specific integrase [uncultured Pontibacter sp.]|uniref:site-specific integrase n=1 Tax=uncultured Pontibacter sp. TaxID=453356 RepID=UPI002631A91D|nr:site-specific integrase [uncultured Pontibacter sp.]
MSKIHTSIIHDTRRPLKDGTYPVKLRITYNKKQKYYPTGIYMTTEDMGKMYGPKPRDHYKKLLSKLTSIEERAVNVIDKISAFTFEQFEKKFFDLSQRDNVFDAFTTKVKHLQSAGRVGTASSYECAMNSLKSFTENEKLVFADITVEYLKAYEKWMLGKGKSLTTVGMYLRALRTLFNDAIAEGDINQDLYPFGKRKYQIPAGKNPKKALKLEDIKKIFQYEPVHDSEARARDLWVFSYLCNGINVKDIARLKYRNLSGDKLTYVRAKTEHTTRKNLKTIVVDLAPETKQIIEKWSNRFVTLDTYIFPILEANVTPEEELAKVRQATKNINNYMKRIAKAVGIEQSVTTYVARHSFSTVLKRTGAPMTLISEALGHNNLKTTESYLDSFEDETRKEYTSKLTAF